MAIELVPIVAYRIDVSDVQDVERERLMVTFKNDKVLYFRFDRSAGCLIVDMNDARGFELGNAWSLRKVLLQHFYEYRVARSATKRLLDALHKLVDSSFRPSFDGWSFDRLASEFRIELRLGNALSDSGLAIGRHLKVWCGTRWSNPLEVIIDWREVAAIESVTLKPVPATQRAAWNVV